VSERESVHPYMRYLAYCTRWNAYVEYKVQPCHPVAHGGASVLAEPCLVHMYYAFMSYVGLTRAERVMLGGQAVL
jgi:hypothetical protein